MKKMLLTLTAAGVLAVPVGVTVAGSDTIETPEPVPTTVEAQRDRERDRMQVDDQAAGGIHHRQAAGEAARGDCDGDGYPGRERNQVRVENETGDGYLERERNQVRVENETGDGYLERERNQVRVAEDPDGAPDPDPRTNADDTAAVPMDDGAQLQFQYGRGHGNG